MEFIIMEVLSRYQLLINWQYLEMWELEHLRHFSTDGTTYSDDITLNSYDNILDKRSLYCLWILGN